MPHRKHPGSLADRGPAAFVLGVLGPFNGCRQVGILPIYGVHACLGFRLSGFEFREFSIKEVRVYSV